MTKYFFFLLIGFLLYSSGQLIAQKFKYIVNVENKQNDLIVLNLKSLEKTKAAPDSNNKCSFFIETDSPEFTCIIAEDELRFRIYDVKNQIITSYIKLSEGSKIPLKEAFATTQVHSLSVDNYFIRNFQNRPHFESKVVLRKSATPDLLESNFPFYHPYDSALVFRFNKDIDIQLLEIIRAEDTETVYVQNTFISKTLVLKPNDKRFLMPLFKGKQYFVRIKYYRKEDALPVLHDIKYVFVVSPVQFSNPYQPAAFPVIDSLKIRWLPNIPIQRIHLTRQNKKRKLFLVTQPKKNIILYADLPYKTRLVPGEIYTFHFYFNDDQKNKIVLSYNFYIVASKKQYKKYFDFVSDR